MANWEGVEEFVAVGTHQSFTTAAKKLNTSVAQVSRRVSALEKKLAVKLLNRTTRRVNLTEAGQLYFQHCKHLVEGLELAELAVTQMQRSPTGTIKVTAPVTYGEQQLSPLFTEFLILYPQVNLDIVFTNQKLDLLEAGIDVAIRLGRLQDSNLIAKRLASRQLYVCANQTYLANHGQPHTIAELNNHQCLVGSMDYWRFRDNEQEKAIRVSGRIKCNSGYSLHQAAKQGLGLVQLPDYYVKEDLNSGQLIEVLSQFRDKQEGIWAVYPENRLLSTKVKLFIEFLAEKLSNK